MSPTITVELLKKQNAETSTAVIDLFKDDENFKKLSQYEGDLTVTRDNEDDEKLAKGIDFAKNKGVIDPNFLPEPYQQIDVLGKTPDDVADIILNTMNKDNNNDNDKGSVIVLVGLSGTGKGTTATKLRQKLESNGKNVVTWSNGNIFRSVTLLAATWCEQNCDDKQFNKDMALTKENLESFINMLSFGKRDDGKYDTHINGLGLDMYVSDVQNTELKAPKVSKNIPTVAEFTQGEVILFAAKAVEMMGKDGLVVLLEGREQTVNYVRSPHRFTLVLSDESLIGKRRAAQRLMAAAAAAEENPTSDADVETALRTALETMVKEIH